MRITLLDAWRSAAVVCMLIYHFLYDICIFGLMTWDSFYVPFLNGMQRFICYSFILISGISSNLSRSNAKRGFFTLACALVVSATACFAGQPILFGILHFLGSAMLIYALVGKFLKKLPWGIGFAASLLLFVLSSLLVESVGPVESRLLWPLGFIYPGFYSSDYFPLLPWIFLFFAGSCLGKPIAKNKDSDFLSMELPKPILWPGQHSMVIYMLHQPVLYAIAMGLSAVLS